MKTFSKQVISNMGNEFWTAKSVGFVCCSSFIFSFIFYPGAAQTNRCPGGGDMVYSDSTGQIKSPGWPSFYPDNLDCNYTVNPLGPREAIRIHFHSFQTENQHDFLQILYIEGTEIHKVTRLSGVDSVQDIVSAPGNGVKFSFHSDSSVRKSGFSATYTRFDVDGCSPVIGIGYVGNDLSSPQLAPDGYSQCCKMCRDNPDCKAYSWQSVSPFQCWIKNATSTSTPLVQMISGIVLRNYKSCACDKLSYTATEELQEISSPNFPKPFCNNIMCFYVIKTTEHKYSVELSLNFVELNSRYDRIDLYEGESNYTSATDKIATITGSSNETSVQTSRSHTMILEFTGGSDQGNRGFHATFKRVNSPCSCHAGDFPDPGDGRALTFSSPGYAPNRNYCDNLKCLYNFAAPDGKVVKIELDMLNTEAGADFLKAYDPRQGADKIQMSWTGELSTSNSFVSNTNKLTLVFQTDSSSTSRGFTGKYKYISRNSNCRCPGPLPKRETGATGTLTSPHYPSAYCGPLDCLWNLIPPSRLHRLTVNLTNFNSRGPLDTLTIAGGSYVVYGGRTLKTFTGEVSAQSFNLEYLSEDGLIFHFRTESAASEGETGFSLTWEWKPKCQCSINAAPLVAGPVPKTLISPDYPGNYCNNLSCKWLITAPVYNQVHTRIVSFRTEAGEDYLSFYDGQSTNAQRLARISGRVWGNGRRVTSTGRFMLIHFTTDGSVTSSGWGLSYSSRETAEATTVPAIRTTTVPPPRQVTTTSKAPVGPVRTDKPPVGETSSGSSTWSVIGWIFFVLFIIVGGGALYHFVLRERIPVWYAQYAEHSGSANGASNIPQGYRNFHRDSQTAALVTDND